MLLELCIIWSIIAMLRGWLPIVMITILLRIVLNYWCIQVILQNIHMKWHLSCKHDSFYWEKKEDAYPHLRKSKFSLELGDTYTKTNSDGSEEVVVVKESDMIMTKGDLNKLAQVTARL